MPNDIHGLELLFSAVKSQIVSSNDVVVCAIHWSLISCDYKCVGLGEDWKEETRKSDVLPAGWADSQDVYVLRYRPGAGDARFTLKIVRMGDKMFIHFMRNHDETVTSMTIKIKDYSTDNISDYENAFKNSSDLKQLVQTDLLQTFSHQTSSRSSAAPTHSQPHPQQQHPQTDSQYPGHDPLRVYPPEGPSRLVNPNWNDPGNPFTVGRSDLDPLGGPGGGMLMDPFRSPSGRLGFDPRQGVRPGLPRGSVPPGARFDPIHPYGIPADPDPDHLPPPGHDNMFM